MYYCFYSELRANDRKQLEFWIAYGFTILGDKNSNAVFAISIFLKAR